NWLVSVQGTDGGWYRHVYAGVAATYTAFASCCLAEFGEQIGEPEYLAAADRHLTWSMRHCDPATGWFDLAGFTREDHAARRALNLVKRGQLMFPDDPNLRGGIPGSDPLWGGYLTYALPNWAAKFFIDAMLERRRSQAGFSTRPDDAGEVPDDVPQSVPISSVGARSPGARSGAHLERLLPGWPSRSEGR